jgi:hypothetical protein
MGRAGLTYVIGGLRARDGRKGTYWLDFRCLVLHLAVCIGVPAMLLSFPEALVAYALRITLMGYAVRRAGPRTPAGRSGASERGSERW